MDYDWTSFGPVSLYMALCLVVCVIEVCKCCGQENKGPEKEVCLFVTCAKSLLECGHDKALVTTMEVTLEQAKADFPTENFCEDWEPYKDAKANCYFCKKVVSAEMDYCYGCGEHVCCDCDETDVYGRHTVEDHRWGEFQRRIMAMDRELIKRKFWAEGLLNTIEQANKDFPTFEPNILDTTNAIAFVSHLVDHIKKVEEWRRTWLSKRP